jgi:hypothetical protein
MRYQNKEQMRVDYIRMRSDNALYLDLFYEIYLHKNQKQNLDFNTFAHMFQMYVHSTQYSLLNDMDIYFNVVKVLDKDKHTIKWM